MGNSRLTLGGWGCTTTDISMLSDFFGEYLSPAQLASRLNLYTNSGLIIWTELNKIFSKFKFTWRQYGFNQALVDESLKNPAKAVILEVYQANKVDKHWIVAARKTWLGLGSDYVGIDPLTGKKINVMAKYGRILGSAHFEKK